MYHRIELKSRPPFVVRKVDKSLISRSPGFDDRRSRYSKFHNRAITDSSLNEARRIMRQTASLTNLSKTGLSAEYCPHCLYPDSADRGCTVCKLYKRYLGKRYWGHHFDYHPRSHRHLPVKIYNESSPRRKRRTLSAESRTDGPWTPSLKYDTSWESSDDDTTLFNKSLKDNSYAPFRSETAVNATLSSPRYSSSPRSLTVQNKTVYDSLSELERDFAFEKRQLNYPY